MFRNITCRTLPWATCKKQSRLQETEPSRMRTETNVFTRTEMSMLRIDDKIAMFSPLIKVRFVFTLDQSADSSRRMFRNITCRTLLFIVCCCCATVGRFAAPGPPNAFANLLSIVVAHRWNDQSAYVTELRSVGWEKTTSSYHHTDGNDPRNTPGRTERTNGHFG